MTDEFVGRVKIFGFMLLVATFAAGFLFGCWISNPDKAESLNPMRWEMINTQTGNSDYEIRPIKPN